VQAPAEFRKVFLEDTNKSAEIVKAPKIEKQ
jgi:hypothetical protein